MYGETLPAWFWVMYYLLLLTILGAAVFSVVKLKHKRMSVSAILFTVTIPAVGLTNSIGREEGMNEFEHLISQLQQGAIWSLFTVTGYVFLAGWCLWLLFSTIKRKQVISSDL
jgi:energy-coupling factor transporter transmembrane protein EcfT